MRYDDIISIENLFQAWEEFKKGKRSKKDVQIFERNLETNLFELHSKLKNKTYKHGSYKSFFVQDPKRRHIHKASVEDRVVHHLLYKFLYELFDPTFVYDSYSCRLGKGTHKGVERLKTFSRKVSENYRRTCFCLKCDIKKFFASVDRKILKSLLNKRIKNENIFWLLEEVIDSFSSEAEATKGIPLGNLTSQIFANIYLNELDQFVKHKLKIRYYIRYADDFVILSSSERCLNQYISSLEKFLARELILELHPEKITVRKLDWGIDFLGYIILPYYVLPRTKTKRRIFKKLKEKAGSEVVGQSLQSYLGYLKHANSHKVVQELKNRFWFWLAEGIMYW
ncbi:hypothetical protein HYT60_02395 [Candidatus Woesebacteria bacterium]|nr:hypothetical protein [Candidatus Woesebacteria bacterium]